MMDRRRFLPTYHYEDNTDGVLVESVGKPLRDYKVYGNSVQNGTPTPEAPVAIESVGDKTVNLFNEQDFFKKACEIETLAGYEPEYLEIDGKVGLRLYGRTCGLGSVADGTRLGIYSGFKDNTQYTFSFDFYDVTALNANGEEAYGAIIYCYYTDGTVNYNLFTNDANMRSKNEWRHRTFTSTAGKTIMRINFTYATGVAQTYFANFQIEEGTTETPYEPYGYKIPIKTYKNLIDFNTVENTNTYILASYGTLGTPSATGGNWRSSDYIKISEGTAYKFEAIHKPASSAGIAWYDASKNYISGVNSTTIKAQNSIIIAPNGAQYIRLSWGIDQEYNPEYINTVKFYKNDDKIYNIYFDEPLRKAGNYADYIDFKNGKVVRVIKEINLSPKIIPPAISGADEGRWYHYASYGNYYYIFKPDEYYAYNNGIASECNSLSFKALSNSSAMTIADGEYYVFYRDTGSSIYRITINEATYNKLLEVDECYFYYPLAEPTEEVIDLPQIPTAKGTCNVAIDTEIQPSGMNWQYYKT